MLSFERSYACKGGKGRGAGRRPNDVNSCAAFKHFREPLELHDKVLRTCHFMYVKGGQVQGRDGGGGCDWKAGGIEGGARVVR